MNQNTQTDLGRVILRVSRGALCLRHGVGKM
jgi:hypothetical protein